jgi:predicted ABC-type ATPase
LKNKCYIIAGPNGAGKTTFANEFLPIEAECLNFINADLIAQGLSPFQPNKMAIEAGRLMIQNINECVKKSESFAFETTLSGKGYLNKIRKWKTKPYEIIIYFLKVPTVEFAIERVKLRVSQGGHNVPEQDIIRRFGRSWINFQQIYKPLADSWVVFDTSGNQPVILDESER